MFLSSIFSAFKVASLNVTSPLRKKLRLERAEHTLNAVSLSPKVWAVLVCDISQGKRSDPWETLDSRWLEIVGVVHDAAQLAARCAELQPDLVLLDVTVPKGDDRACLNTLREMNPDVKIVILTESASIKSMGEANLMRASYAVPIDSPDNLIEQAICEALNLTV